MFRATVHTALAFCRVVVNCSGLKRRAAPAYGAASGFSFAVGIVLAMWLINPGLSEDDSEQHKRSVVPVERLMKLSERIVSGGEPQGRPAFEFLKEMGIQTIISVDGARPRVELARQFDMQYVHIPFGYDDIPREAALAITRAVRESEGNVYIHCHHGKHRGPAAAAIACQVEGSADKQRAIEIMTQAGTSKDYAGLWKAVSQFTVPGGSTKLPELHEIAPVESLAAAMAKLSRNFDNLRLCEQANWKSPAEHPDVTPSQEILLVQEAFHEMIRNPAVEYDSEFTTMLRESEQQAIELRANLAARDLNRASLSLQHLNDLCSKCHESYRN